MISDTVILVAVRTPEDVPEPDAGYSVMLNSAVVMATDSDGSATPQYVQNAAGAIADGVCVHVYQIEVVSEHSVSAVQDWLIDYHALDQGIEGVVSLFKERNGSPIGDGSYTIVDMRVRYDLGSEDKASVDPDQDSLVDQIHAQVIRHATHDQESDFKQAAQRIERECQTWCNQNQISSTEMVEFIRMDHSNSDPLEPRTSEPSPTLMG